ncbi:sarcosine oxidase [Marmoricola sp. Leaf446]|uniref:FAD-dependent oxidoreductase n=1 Tax=Marmoricola sp. Leaf446 TaxID=1736379 RepID=UPI00070048E6|nr:FAD-dependent oxidoreductase [Marmoricola sp. Leaf446]KQT93549.1 sarcosine oxidase [Marmoricola sp. Leaf446]
MTTNGTAAYAVVGAGLVGAATAWQLAARGHDVVVLERGVPADPGGSSHGSARIFRYAYADPFYVDLVRQARLAWDDLETAHGSELVRPTGALDHGAERDPAGLARALEAVGVEHELLGASEARARFEGIDVDSEVLWHPGAGVIDAERAVHAMLDLARSHGARVLTGWAVQEVAATGSGHRVTATDGRGLDAGHVVVAAGGWLPGLLDRLGLPSGFRDAVPHLEVWQEEAFHFPHRDGHDPWPTTIHGTGEMLTYSLPGGRDAGHRGQKVAQFCGGRAIGTAEHQDGQVDPAHRERIVEHVRRTLPGLVPEPYAETTCLFTSTPTEDFVLDRCEGLTLVSACSGHGAKFAPLLGAMVADAAAATDPDAARRLVPARFHVG